jgi:predicted metalloprotease with PDZ domain
MKRITWLVAPVMLMILAAPIALAGDYAKCPQSTQECLDMMAAKLKNKGWIGLELNDDSGKLAITKVFEGSPAEKAGLEAGDVLFAVAGVEYSEANNDKLAQIRDTMTPGKTFTFTILKGGEEKADVDITLAPLPEDVLDAWVGKHLLEQHASLAQAQSAKP